MMPRPPIDCASSVHTERAASPGRTPRTSPRRCWSGWAGQLPKQRCHLVRRALPAELLGALPRGPTEGFPELRVVQQQAHAVTQGNGIRDEISGRAVDDGLGQTTLAPGNDRQSTGHGLERRDAELLTVRCEDR